MSASIVNLINNCDTCRVELNTIKCFLKQTIVPFLCGLSEAVIDKLKPTDKTKFQSKYGTLNTVASQIEH